MSKVRLTRIFWIGAAAILVASALVAIAALLRGRFGDTDWKILVTLLALLGWLLVPVLQRLSGTTVDRPATSSST